MTVKVMVWVGGCLILVAAIMMVTGLTPFLDFSVSASGMFIKGSFSLLILIVGLCFLGTAMKKWISERN